MVRLWCELGGEEGDNVVGVFKSRAEREMMASEECSLFLCPSRVEEKIIWSEDGMGFPMAPLWIP